MSFNNDSDLFSTMIRVENKDIFVDLKQNANGIYLKLSERNGKNRNTVLIPASGISKLKSVLDEVTNISLKDIPSPVFVSNERKSRIESDPEVINRSVYVSDLAWATTDEVLAAHFATAGPVVKAVVLKKNRRGKLNSLGCAVVEFKSAAIAQRAIALFNETELEGRVIKCREDRNVDSEVVAVEQEPVVKTVASPAVVKESKAVDRTNRVLVPDKIFVTSLAWETTPEDLIDFFNIIGDVVSADILTSKKGRSLGHGIVQFSDASSAREAIERLHNKDLGGRNISIREYYQL